MNIQNGYLVKQTSLMVSIVLLAIAGLLFVTGIADEAARRMTDTYTLQSAVIYKFSTLSAEVYEYIGVIVMLGTLITVASFNKHQELTIIQLSAASAPALLLRLLLPALILLPIVYGIGEFAAPSWQNNAEQARALLRGEKNPTLRGQWYKANNEYVNVEFISNETELTGITRFQMNPQKQLMAASYSKRAVYSDGSWVLINTIEVKRTERGFERKTMGISSWENAVFTPELVRNLALESSNLTLPELWTQVRFRAEAGTLTPALERTLWNRVLFPLQYIGLMFVALAFAFGSFRQKTIGDAAFKALVLGVISGLLIDTLSASLMVLAMPAFAAVLVSNSLFTGLAFYLLKRRY
ncbi:LptF/LptG family permease [Reinekea blandensis]|uniref:Permease n=1 Tax=Reinekea blandensis MED297 TaxID=314283 RepID=A4BIX2_9GAMM|nr:LptF/LptG family permease [Reinekea blandensis]EAR07905.1 hypothetical protein MED297_15285 [Reinekea sp. MED297] [Reinekea blandensis MED297]